MRHPAIIVRHPACPPVQFVPPVTPASIAAAKADCYARRAKLEAEHGIHIDENGSFHLPAPLVSEPLVIGAALDRPTGDICVVCHELVELHWDSSGCLWIGCLGAMNRRNGHEDGG